MYKLAVSFLLIALPVSAVSQSVADAARTSRDKQKSQARKTITDDDMAPAPMSSGDGNWQNELDRMKTVFEQICSDPKTENGRMLGDQDKQAIDEAVKPLRARIEEINRRSKEYKEEFAKLDKEQEAVLLAAASKGEPTEEDRQKALQMKSEFDTKRSVLKEKVDKQLKENEKLKNDVVEVGTACPAAAATVK